MSWQACTWAEALRFYGGKWKQAAKIAALFPPHRIYVEPFGGAASGEGKDEARGL